MGNFLTVLWMDDEVMRISIVTVKRLTYGEPF